MKEFFNPTMEVISLNANDVITTSTDCGTDGSQHCFVDGPSNLNSSKGW